MIGFARSLSKKTASANAGNLIGNRMFYANDYMVCGLHTMEVAGNAYEFLQGSSRF